MGLRESECELSDNSTHSGQGVQAVGRALDLLDLLSELPREVSARELSRASELPYATTHRLLATLTERRYAVQNPHTKAYSLGPKLVLAGAQIGSRLGKWTRPYLAKMMEFSGESANLAILDDWHVSYIAQVQSHNQLRMFTQVGNRVLPHATAMGKVLLAARPRVEVEEGIQRYGLPPITKNTITDAGLFMNELDRVEQQGFALDQEEGELGVNCLAVPLIVRGDVVAGISLSGPVGRMSNAKLKMWLPRMQEVASEAGAVLGTDQIEQSVRGLKSRPA